MKKLVSSRLFLAVGISALSAFPALSAPHAGTAPLSPSTSGLEYHCAIAETYLELNDHASAMAVLRLAFKPDPADASGYFRLAEICRAAGDRPRAVAAYGRALEKDPSDTRAAFGLAFLHEEMGNPLRALSVLKKAGANGMARRESLMEMARIYRAMGQDWPALDCYLRAAELGESRAATGMLKIGKRLFDHGDVGRAREVFSLIRTAFPKDMEVGRALAVLDS